jgi:hypothetical protein
VTSTKSGSIWLIVDLPQAVSFDISNEHGDFFACVSAYLPFQHSQVTVEAGAGAERASWWEQQAQVHWAHEASVGESLAQHVLQN